MDNIPSIDMTVANELRDLLESGFNPIIIEFKDEIITYKSDLDKFNSTTDIDNLIILSHTIKSSSASLVFMRISEYCRQIEEGLRQNPELDVTSIIQHCHTEFDCLIDEIKSILN